MENSKHPFLSSIAVQQHLVELIVKPINISTDSSTKCEQPTVDNTRTYQVYSIQKFKGRGKVLYADSFGRPGDFSTRAQIRLDVWSGVADKAIEKVPPANEDTYYWPVATK